MSRQSAAPFHSISRRGFLGGSLGLAALGALTACGSAGGASGGAAGNGTQSAFTYLSYLPMETLSVAPELMAAAGGYFADQGLDVTFQTTKGSPQAIQTLVSGAGPLTRVGLIDLMTAAADGQPLVNVGSIVRGSSIRTLYSTDVPLASPEDFVGKTVGVPSEGGTSDKSLSLMLHKAGIDPSEVQRQVVGLGPGTFELVKRGDIAGYMVSIDQAITTMNQYPGEADAFDSGYQVRADSQIYTASRDSLEQHGDAIRGYLTAIKQATQAMVDDENLDHVLETLRGEYSFASLDDDDIAREALKQARALWTADGTAELLVTDESYWEDGYQELVDAGLVESGHDVTEWVDNSFVSA